MKINERGYWENETEEGHGVDERLAEALLNFFWTISRSKQEFITVIDIGCGNGFYTNYINRERGPVVCYGYDGNPNTPQITNGSCGVMDFTQPLTTYSEHNWGLCLEVGEHIPPEYEEIFFDNIDKLCKDGIILSWAVEGQGGDGHVNCHNNEYVIDKMNGMGFWYDESNTLLLRELCTPYPFTGWWFNNTLMVFRKHWRNK